MTVITLGQKMGSMHLFRIFTEKLRVLWLIQKKKKKKKKNAGRTKLYQF